MEQEKQELRPPANGGTQEHGVEKEIVDRWLSRHRPELEAAFATELAKKQKQIDELTSALSEYAGLMEMFRQKNTLARKAIAKTR